jgi:hypothetical protein
MPYLVYNIIEHPESGTKKLTHLETYPDYHAAREHVKEERNRLVDAGDQETICRLIHAKNEVAAAKLLTHPRDDRVIAGDS